MVDARTDLDDAYRKLKCTSVTTWKVNQSIDSSGLLNGDPA